MPCPSLFRQLALEMFYGLLLRPRRPLFCFVETFIVWGSPWLGVFNRLCPCPRSFALPVSTFILAHFACFPFGNASATTQEETGIVTFEIESVWCLWSTGQTVGPKLKVIFIHGTVPGKRCGHSLKWSSHLVESLETTSHIFSEGEASLETTIRTPSRVSTTWLCCWDRWSTWKRPKSSFFSILHNVPGRQTWTDDNIGNLATSVRMQNAVFTEQPL